MGNRYRKSEGGRGGKLGRSHMGGLLWWSPPDLKDLARRRRRTNDRCSVEEGVEACRCGLPPSGGWFDPNWQTADVVGLARSIADTDDFTALPLLGDALIDAGCDDEFVLSHCRDVAAHTRGCWLIDRVLRRW